ncbi:MAG: DUF4349 domain-containing protein, partial [Candidatus Limnocylindria bacterium]
GAGDGDRTGVDSAAGEPAADGGSGVSDPDDSAAPPFAAPVEQRIVKTGEVTLEVDQVGEALGRVRALAVELGGYVGGSQAGTLDDRASLTIRIPATSFDEAIARLHEMDAEVLAEATREQDVTGEVVDLEARIDNLRASEASYRELVARAERVEDILAVQSRLDEVRGQIEQLTAQLDAIEGQAALSTLTITLIPKAAPIEAQTETWDPGAQLDRALASLMGIGQGLLNGVIWFAVVWLPILLVLSFIVLIALRGVLEVRRRLPVARHEPRPAGDDATA